MINITIMITFIGLIIVVKIFHHPLDQHFISRHFYDKKNFYHNNNKKLPQKNFYHLQQRTFKKAFGLGIKLKGGGTVDPSSK